MALQPSHIGNQIIAINKNKTPVTASDTLFTWLDEWTKLHDLIHVFPIAHISMENSFIITTETITS